MVQKKLYIPQSTIRSAPGGERAGLESIR